MFCILSSGKLRKRKHVWNNTFNLIEEEAIVVYIIISLFAIRSYGQTVENEKYAIGEKSTVFSSILGEEREIFVYKPKGFCGMDEEMENYPVTYVLDGESQFLNTVSAIEYISAAPQGNDLMPRTIVVGIPNTNRVRDLTPKKGLLGQDSTSLEMTGGGTLFLEFITCLLYTSPSPRDRG